MHFDADALLDALRPPTITLGGRTFSGRVLSAAEAFVFEGRLQAIRQSEEGSYDQVVALLGDLARAMYPRPWWRFWARSLATELARTPLAVQLRLFTDFSRCLTMTLRVSPASGTTEEETTGGSVSAPPSDT